jgi:hypothetical protein
MSIRVQIAHQTAGRIRVQLPEHRGERELFDHISHLIAESGLVRTVRANPVTGSIVLEFSGAPNALLAGLAKSLPIEIVATAPANHTRSALSATHSPFRLVSGRQINPMLMVGTLFGAVGVVQTLRGQVLVPALSAFWYAAKAFGRARKQTQGSAAE